MRHLVAEAGLAERVTIDSAGTGAWHVGEPPDRRSAEAAARRGITLEGAARQVRVEDFAEFDLLLAADRRNHADLLRLAPDDAARAKVRMLRDFEPGEGGDVPDPYYGGPRGFDDVLDIVERACRGLLTSLDA